KQRMSFWLRVPAPLIFLLLPLITRLLLIQPAPLSLILFLHVWALSALALSASSWVVYGIVLVQKWLCLKLSIASLRSWISKLPKKLKKFSPNKVWIFAPAVV